MCFLVLCFIYLPFFHTWGILGEFLCFVSLFFSPAACLLLNVSVELYFGKKYFHFSIIKVTIEYNLHIINYIHSKCTVPCILIDIHSHKSPLLPPTIKIWVITESFLLPLYNPSLSPSLSQWLAFYQMQKWLVCIF